MKTLEAAQAAENFVQVLHEVQLRHVSFEIVKEGVPQAHLVPAAVRPCDSHGLADDLDGAELTAADRRALAADVRRGRQVLKPLGNPWG